jgi:hypothetical protein
MAPPSTPGGAAFDHMLDTPGYFNWSALAGGRDSLVKLYADPERRLWVVGGRPTAAAIALLQELRNAADRGLDPEDYPGNRLDYLLLALSGAQHSDPAQWALFDVGLSYAAMRLIADLHFGRIDPAAVGHQLSTVSWIWPPPCPHSQRRTTSPPRSMPWSRSSGISVC